MTRALIAEHGLLLRYVVPAGSVSLPTKMIMFAYHYGSEKERCRTRHSVSRRPMTGYHIGHLPNMLHRPWTPTRRALRNSKGRTTPFSKRVQGWPGLSCRSFCGRHANCPGDRSPAKPQEYTKEPHQHLATSNNTKGGNPTAACLLTTENLSWPPIATSPVALAANTATRLQHTRQLLLLMAACPFSLVVCLRFFGSFRRIPAENTLRHEDEQIWATKQTAWCHGGLQRRASASSVVSCA